MRNDALVERIRTAPREGDVIRNHIGITVRVLEIKTADDGEQIIFARKSRPNRGYYEAHYTLSEWATNKGWSDVVEAKESQ